MVTKIVKWENCHGIQISEEVVPELGLPQGEQVDSKAINGKDIDERTFRHRTLEERAEQFRGRLGPYTEITDWGTPEGRDVW